MDDAFSYRLEILKKELDAIDSAIRKIDDIGNSIKNWAILTWTGSIAAILGKPDIHRFILFTAVPPVLFMLVDANWRKIQRRLIYRQGQISDYLNSKIFTDDFEKRTLSIDLLDPIARKVQKMDDFKRFISIRRILKFPTISLIYVGLSLLSIVMAVILFVI